MTNPSTSLKTALGWIWRIFLFLTALIFTAIGVYSAAQLPQSITKNDEDFARLIAEICAGADNAASCLAEETEAQSNLFLVSGIGVFIGSIGVLILIGFYQRSRDQKQK